MGSLYQLVLDSFVILSVGKGRTASDDRARGEEVAEQLGALAALTKDPGSIPSMHTVAHNYL